MKRSRKFQNKGNNSRPAGANELCHKYGKPRNLIKDFPMHKIDYQEYL